jgi:hypothetical protein
MDIATKIPALHVERHGHFIPTKQAALRQLLLGLSIVNMTGIANE